MYKILENYFISDLINILFEYDYDLKYNYGLKCNLNDLLITYNNDIKSYILTNLKYFYHTILNSTLQCKYNSNIFNLKIESITLYLEFENICQTTYLNKFIKYNYPKLKCKYFIYNNNYNSTIFLGDNFCNSINEFYNLLNDIKDGKIKILNVKLSLIKVKNLNNDNFTYINYNYSEIYFKNKHLIKNKNYFLHIKDSNIKDKLKLYLYQVY